MARRLKDQVNEIASIIDNQSAGVVAVDASTAIDELEPTPPLFTIDHDAMRQSCENRARMTITRIVNHVMSEEDASSPYVKQKMEIDIASLTNLLVSQAQNAVLTEAMITKLAIDGMPTSQTRVFAEFRRMDAELNKQILESEAVYRATYTQLKYEVQQRRFEGSHLELSSGEASKPKFASERISVGSKDLIKERNLKKKQLLMAVKVEEADAEIIENNEDSKE